MPAQTQIQGPVQNFSFVSSGMMPVGREEYGHGHGHGAAHSAQSQTQAQANLNLGAPVGGTMSMSMGPQKRKMMGMGMEDIIEYNLPPPPPRQHQFQQLDAGGQLQQQQSWDGMGTQQLPPGLDESVQKRLDKGLDPALTGVPPRTNTNPNPRKRKGPPASNSNSTFPSKSLGGKDTATSDRREDIKSYTDLHTTSHILSTHPSQLSLYNLRLLPLTIERAAYIRQFKGEEELSLGDVRKAFGEEKKTIEDECERGMERLRERLLEVIEERRKVALGEKDVEVGSETSLDPQTRPPTRKLRNKQLNSTSTGRATSPIPTPLPTPTSTAYPHPNAHSNINGTSIGAGGTSLISPTQFLNPHSLSIDELPSPFPLPLTSAHIPNGAISAYAYGSNPASSLNPYNGNPTTSTNTTSGGASGGGGAAGSGGGAKPGRRGARGTHPGGPNGIGVLGKSLGALVGCKDVEVENDLNEILRAGKRKRGAGGGYGKV